MNTLTRVFVAGTIGSFVASWAEPKVLPHLPQSLKTESTAKFTHAAITGLSGVAVYYGLGKLGVGA